MAVGFALANAIMIEGDGSNIIIDTTGTVETAQEVKDLFDSINSNPVEATSILIITVIIPTVLQFLQKIQLKFMLMNLPESIFPES